MGASAASMVEELPCNIPKMLGKRSRHAKRIARMILKHALSGIDFLHKNGVVHGDVQPGKMLFATIDLHSVGKK